MLHPLKSAAAAALGVWLPTFCIGCERPGPALCSVCLNQRPAFGEPRCLRCEATVGDDAPICRACTDSPVAWVAAAAPYVSPWREWIRRFKFGPEPSLAAPLADALAETLLDEEPSPDWLLVPIPPGNRAGILRGPHPPAALARHMATRTGLAQAPVLRRRRPGTPQRHLPREARQQLAHEVFATQGLPKDIRTVVLVDDVMTTGATLRAAARALMNAWPGLYVAAAVLARAGAPALASGQETNYSRGR